MNWILDLLVVGVVLFFIIMGVRRGFVSTLLDVAGTLLAVVLAFSLSASLSSAIYQSFVEPAVSNAVDSALADYTGKAIEDTVNDLWEKNSTITYFAGLSGVDKADVIAGAAEKSQSGVEAVSTFVKDTIARPVATMVVRVVLLVVLLLVLVVLFKFLAKLIGKLFTFSLLGKINSVLGGVLGGVKGLLAAMIFCAVAGAIITASAQGVLGFTKESIDQSTLFAPLFGLTKLG